MGKKEKLYVEIAVFFCICFFTFMSCTSMKDQNEDPPVQMGSLSIFGENFLGKTVPLEISIWYIPDSDTMEIRAEKQADSNEVIFSLKRNAADSIIKAAEYYKKQKDSLVKENKPEKNVIAKTNAKIKWGYVGASNYTATIPLYATYGQIKKGIDRRKMFMLYALKAREDHNTTSTNIMSPTVSWYISDQLLDEFCKSISFDSIQR